MFWHSSAFITFNHEKNLPTDKVFFLQAQKKFPRRAKPTHILRPSVEANKQSLRSVLIMELP